MSIPRRNFETNYHKKRPSRLIKTCDHIGYIQYTFGFGNAAQVCLRCGYTGMFRNAAFDEPSDSLKDAKHDNS